MQKLRLQNKYDKDTKRFNKDLFELRESDGTISGKVNVSSKKGEEWVSKSIPFVAFKSQIDEGTTHALLNSRGKTFEAECNLMVDSFVDQGTKKNVIFFKLVISEAKFEGEAPQVEAAVNSDDSIPF